MHKVVYMHRKFKPESCDTEIPQMPLTVPPFAGKLF